jgi:hypothetical protein
MNTFMTDADSIGWWAAAPLSRYWPVALSSTARAMLVPREDAYSFPAVTRS